MKCILVIEDDDQERQMFKVALEEGGYKVLTAPEGETGLHVFHQHSCDLVLSDLYMPQKEGLETIFELKTERPDLKIIAMTGGTTWIHHSGDHSADNILSIAKTLGADRTLEKPIKITTLLKTIEELLGEAR